MITSIKVFSLNQECFVLVQITFPDLQNGIICLSSCVKIRTEQRKALGIYGVSCFFIIFSLYCLISILIIFFGVSCNGFRK